MFFASSSLKRHKEKYCSIAIVRRSSPYHYATPKVGHLLPVKCPRHLPPVKRPRPVTFSLG